MGDAVGDISEPAVRPIPMDPSAVLFDARSIDLDARVIDKAGIEAWIPHRGDMSLLDAVVWLADDQSRCIGVKHCRDDEFWVQGHFPEMPLLPGVLMIEAAAQLMCMQYNMRFQARHTGIFTRIEGCSFRQSVTVDEKLYLMIEEIRFARRGFQAQTQGWVNGALAFDAKLSGIVMPDKLNGPESTRD